MIWWWVAGTWLALSIGVSLVVVRTVRLADRRSMIRDAVPDAAEGRPAAAGRRLLRLEDHVRGRPRTSARSQLRACSPISAGTASSIAGKPPAP
jgi:hypothetical protein